MNNQSGNDEAGQEVIIPISYSRMIGVVLLMLAAAGFLVFMFQGGWLLLMVLFTGDFCC